MRRKLSGRLEKEALVFWSPLLEWCLVTKEKVIITPGLFFCGKYFLEECSWIWWVDYAQETVEASDLLPQSLYGMMFFKIENKSVFYKPWYIKKFSLVNDLVDESGILCHHWTKLINKFKVKCPFLQAYGIICAIPSSWKSKIREFGKRLLVVKSQNIERLFKTKKVTSFTYDILRKSAAIRPIKMQCKCNKHRPSSVGVWSTYYRNPFLCTSASKLRSF